MVGDDEVVMSLECPSLEAWNVLRPGRVCGQIGDDHCHQPGTFSINTWEIH